MMNVGDSVQIKGCSAKTRHLETSTGNSSVDSILGGGLPNTSIYVVDEVKSRVYGLTLAKYFISEGLYNDHDILVAGPTSQTSELLNTLPSKCETSTSTSGPSSQAEPPRLNDSMKIAWRYEAVGQVKSSLGSKSTYDLQKILGSKADFRSVITSFPSDKNEDLSYDLFLTKMKEILQQEKYQKSRGPAKNLLRIVLLGLGSPYWSDSENYSKFLAKLQVLSRNYYCVVLATACSSAMIEDQVRELEVTSDVYFRLLAITDEERKSIPGMDKFHGYFHLIRLPTIVSPAFPKPPAVDLAFELHRKSFDIKVLHLPPALGTEPPAKTACNIDF